ncbi:MAG: hypothetical protein QF704_17485, partial [Anaerolineales bacterium]|nr:hypothetical protein [Anaerolineales bacterium]
VRIGDLEGENNELIFSVYSEAVDDYSSGFIFENGKVGIGNTAPPQPLTVEGNISGSGTFQVQHTDPQVVLKRSNHSAHAGHIDFTNNADTVGWQIGVSQAVGLGLEFNEGDETNNRMYIAPGGDVTFPVANQKISGSSSSTGSFGDGRFAGKVGIGQTAPSTTLHIGDGASHYVRIENASSGDVTSGYQIYRGGSVGMSLYDNPADNATTLLTAGAFNLNANGGTLDFGIDTSGDATFTGNISLTSGKNITSGNMK